MSSRSPTLDRRPLAPLVSLISFLVIVVNLALCSLPLIALSLIKLAIPAARPAAYATMARIYRAAVRVDDWWLQRVVGVSWNQPLGELDIGRTFIVLANHRSWLDVFLIQSAFAKQGLIVKFLTKREIVYLPILGLIVWAFDFPLLRRRARSGEDRQARRDRDRRSILEACKIARRSPAALLIFAEGTRFTTAKHRRLSSPYEHLLPTRPAGFTIAIEALSESIAGVIDLTLICPQRLDFWGFLGGTAEKLYIESSLFSPRQLPTTTAGLSDWLRNRWLLKDRRLHEVALAHGPED